MVNLEVVRSGMGSMAVQAFPLDRGDAGVAQTIRAMRRLIDQGKKDPKIHEAAAQIIRASAVPAYDWGGEIRAIYNWVLHNIRFTRDVYGKETLHAAPEILRLGIGDCDDFTILICSLLGTIGHKTRILTISKPGDERNFSHVFPQVFVNGQWLTLDAARRGAAIGRNPENVDRVRIWDTSSDNFVDVEGLSGHYDRQSLSGPAGRRPNALPGAYPAFVADPRFRNLRGHSLRGLGRYGAAEVRKALASMRQGMGQDDGVDWSAVTQAISAGTTGAANIISATRAAPYNLFPTTSYNPNAPAVARTSPLLTSPYGALTSPFGAGGISTTTLLLLGIGAVVLIGAERGR
jgi:Transglutaminase-like superfamily